MRLFRINTVADEVMHVDRAWGQNVYARRGCEECGYLRNDQRVEPLDIVLSDEPGDARAGVLDLWVDRSRRGRPTAPRIGTWGIGGCDVFRRDLIEDLRLESDACSLGKVYFRDRLLPDYQSVIVHHARWVFGISRPMRRIDSCKVCNRLGWNAQSDEMFIVKESLRREGDVLKELWWPDVYSLIGLRMIISDRAVERIRPSTMKELKLTELKIVSVNEIDFSTGEVVDL